MSYDTETKKTLAKAVVTMVNTQKELKTKIEDCLKKAQYFENVGDRDSYIKASHEAQFLNMECFVTFARTTGAIAQYASVMGANPLMN